MHVAYLTNQYPKTSHTFVRREIDGLEELGFTVDRFSVRRTTDPLVHPADVREAENTFVLFERNFLALFVSVMQMAWMRPYSIAKAGVLAVQFGWSSDRGLVPHMVYLLEAALLARELKRRHIHHVHAHFGTNSATVAMLCSEMAGGTFSFTVHGPEEFDRPRGIGLSQKIRSAAFVVAISEFGRSQLYRWCAATDWAKIHVVHCIVDDEFLDGPPPSVPSSNRLVCVGRLCEQKGQLLLVQAVAALAKDGLEPKLRLVGDGELRNAIEDLITELGIEDYVEILGWKSSEEVAEELKLARAFVLPSFAEGLPVAIMEAMASHRPVVSTYVAGIPELVRPGRNGWLVPAGSLYDLSKALREVLESETETLTEMGKAGALDVSANHYASTEAEKLKELFLKYVAPPEDRAHVAAGESGWSTPSREIETPMSTAYSNR